MPARPTLADVAAAAGLSVATVDRVLNGRAPVREATAQRVYEAAQAIGYHAAAVIRQRLRAELTRLRLGIVLRKERQAFYRHFAGVVEQAVRQAPNVRGQAHVVFQDTDDPDGTAACLERLAERVDAVAAIAIDHPRIAHAVQGLKARGVPTFALLSDFAQGARQGYVGLDNLKVGRMAAWMIAKTAPPGKVALFVGGHRWHGHDLRETGFRAFFREYAPDFRVLDAVVNLETRRLTYEATLDMLSRHPDLRGVYVAGGGMEGALEAVRERAEPERLAVVVNELTPESRAALQDRYASLVIATPLARLCGELIGLATAARLGGGPAAAGQHFLAAELHIPESL